MPGIFISHRREDESGWSRLIHDKLSAEFGDDHVFFDLEDIGAGDDFARVLRDTLRSADVLIAIIGPKWLTTSDASGKRRLENSDDFVVQEIGMAIERDIRVIPLTVNGADPPPESELPGRLQKLAGMHVQDVTPEHVDADIKKLIGVLTKIVQLPQSGDPMPQGRPDGQNDASVELNAATQEPPDTVTFLFTDIEGSTNLWENHLEAMRSALARHDHILHSVIEGHGGQIFSEAGDGVAAAFPSAKSALAAAIDSQRQLIAETWREIDNLGVRMAVMTGAEQQRDGNYYGPTLNRAARMLELANSGQILVSRSTQEMVHDRMPPGAQLEDLGSHSLRSLTKPEHVFQVTHDVVALSAAPLRTEPKVSPLPLRFTRFVGRESDVQQVRDALRKSRVITITGAGGTGKTRLAVEVADSLHDEYPDGVFFVGLEPVVDEVYVVKRIAEVLGVHERPPLDMLSVLVAELRSSKILLIMDNCEQVIVAAARAIAKIVRSCPEVTVLATSREELALAGEVDVRVQGLPVVAEVGDLDLEELARVDSIELFVDRARAANAEFILSTDNASDVARLCNYLDGIPLALELAAARVSALTPGQILDELKKHLSILRSRSRTVEARHQTIESTIEWSHGLLPPEQQSVFVRLSILEGSFTMEAAKAVARDGTDIDVFDDVLELIAKSLLTPEDGNDGRSRYRMLTMLRQFGRERLKAQGEYDQLAERHADYFLDRAEEIAPDLQGSDKQHAQDQLEQQHDNYRVALDWMVGAGKRDKAARLAIALRWFWYWGGHVLEGYASLERVLALLEDDRDVLLATVSMAAGVLADVHGDLAAASRHLEFARELAEELDERPLLARTLVAIGVVAKDHGQLSEAAKRFEASIGVGRSLGEDMDYGIALRFSGEIAYIMGDLDAAEEQLDSAREIVQRLGRSGESAWVATHIGELQRRRGELTDARAQLVKAESMHLENDYKRGIAWSQLFRAGVEMDLGNTDGSFALSKSACKIFEEVRDQRGVPYALLGLSETALRSGDRVNALADARAAMAAAQAVGDLRAVAWSHLAIYLAGTQTPDREDLRSALEALHAIGDVLGIHRSLMAAGVALGETGDHELAAKASSAAATLVPAELTGVEAPAKVQLDPATDVDSVVALALEALTD